MPPELADLIASREGKIQLDPWTGDGALRIAPLLQLLSGIDLVQGVSPPADFRWRDVEPLIEQASALLDRVLADRSAFQAVGEKYATLTLDLFRTTKLVAETDKEIADLRFEVPSKVSTSRDDAQQRSIDGIKNQLDSLNNNLTYFTDKKGHLSDLAGWAQYLNLSDPGGPDQTAWGGPDLGTFHKPFNRVALGSGISADIQTIDNDLRWNEMKAASDAVAGEYQSAVETKYGTEAQAEWDRKNVEHLAARAQVEKDALSLKLAMANVGWLLDFKAQMESIKPRAQQSLVDAYQRLQSVEEGTAKVYGRVTKPGSIVDALPPLTGEVRNIDEIILWTRRTATWLAAMTRRFHNYVQPISVRVLTGPAWNAGAGARTWKVPVPESAFTNEALIRVRGLAAWVVSGDPKRLWTVEVTLPNATTMVYGPGVKVSLKQGTINCKLSGVTTRTNRLVPEVCGTTSCYNASPIGDWTIKISDALDPNAGGVPEDIQIDLSLSVLPI